MLCLHKHFQQSEVDSINIAATDYDTCPEKPYLIGKPDIGWATGLLFNWVILSPSE